MEQKIDVDSTFRRFRIQEVATMTIVYAIFYVCLPPGVLGCEEGHD